MTSRNRFAVVGGGITGLAAAYQLRASLGPSAEIILLEASNRVGGKIETERVGGLLLELGPDAFLTTKPWAVQLSDDLGMRDQLIGTNLRRRDVFILHENRLEMIPEGLIMMVPTNLRTLATTPLLSPAGKLRAALEFLIPPKRERGSESIQEFVVRRFGPELYHHIVEPMMSGIYAGDGSRLSIDATFPILPQWERELGSVARGALRLRSARRVSPENGKTPKSLFNAPRDGMVALVERLESQLKKSDIKILTNQPVLSIQKASSGYALNSPGGESLIVAGLVLATPSFVSADLLSSLVPDVASLLGGIEYASTVTVNLAFEEKGVSQLLSGYGYVIPSSEDRLGLACTWTSTKFDHRAPQGTALLRVFLGRVGQGWILEESDEFLIEQARKEIEQTMGIAAEPCLVRVKRWPRAMPQYTVGHLSLIHEIENALRVCPGIKLAGADYHGIGIPDCIHSGREAAKELAGSIP